MATSEELKDLQFARACLNLKIVDRKQLKACFKIQENYRVGGKYLTMAKILLDKGFLNPGQIKNVNLALTKIRQKSLAGQETEVLQETGKRHERGAENILPTEQVTEIVRQNEKEQLKGGEGRKKLAPKSLQSTIKKEKVSKKRKKIGRYAIVEEIGHGGMGRVYRARDLQLDRQVALKELICGEGAGGQEVQRFLREAKATAHLRHPNIVAIHDLGKHEGSFFFTMDLIEGGSLREALIKTPPTPEKTVQWMIEISEAVHYAHTNNIIHRDLKPANVMLDGQKPKVMDFGLAKIIDDSTNLSHSGMILGTLRYMAPEQAQGDLEAIDARSDVYSLGVMLYEMLAGKTPFSGDTAFAIIHQVLSQNPAPPQNPENLVPGELQNICLKAMAKKKECRYQSAKEMADDLRAFITGESISARPPKIGAHLFGKARQNPAVIIAVFAVIAIASVLFAIFGQKTRTVIVDNPAPVLRQKAEEARVLKVHAQTLSFEHKPREHFIDNEPVVVEIYWESSEKNEGQDRILIYGDGIHSCEISLDLANGKHIYQTLELIKACGYFEVTVQVRSNGVVKETKVCFEVERPVKQENLRETEARIAYGKYKKIPQGEIIRRWEFLHEYCKEYENTEPLQEAAREKENIEREVLEKLTKTQEESRRDLAYIVESKNTSKIASLLEKLQSDTSGLDKIRQTSPQINEKITQLRLCAQEAIRVRAELKTKTVANTVGLEEWEAEFRGFLSEEYLKLMKDRDFHAAKARLKDLAKRKPSIASSFAIDRTFREVQTTEILLELLNAVFRKNVGKNASMKLSTVDGRVKGRAISLYAGERLSLLTGDNKAIHIDFTSIEESCLVKLLKGKEHGRRGEISYSLGLLCILNEPKRARRQMQNAKRLGFEPPEIIMEKLAKLLEKKRPSPKPRKKDKPRAWPPELWDICWFSREKIVDFTKPEWVLLDCREQLHLVREYQKWYAKRSKLGLYKIEERDGMKFRLTLIPPGRIFMKAKNESTMHAITLTSPFWLGICEVRQEQWFRLTDKNPWLDEDDEYPHNMEMPATYISWKKANKFCEENGFILPSEAQWEYACRCGTDTPYFWGEEINESFCFTDSDDDYPREVGKRHPNGFGLYDMSGNVYEWCSDTWQDSYDGLFPNGAPRKDKGDDRVIRGGSFESNESECRSAQRKHYSKKERHEDVGFRVALPDRR